MDPIKNSKVKIKKNMTIISPLLVVDMPAIKGSIDDTLHSSYFSHDKRRRKKKIALTERKKEDKRHTG
jgi:hypothetical protein